MSKRGQEMQAKILAILREAGTALSAYNVLDELKASHPKIAPPTVYNALAALISAGRVHRVESLKAYIACQFRSGNHTSVLSICRECGIVEEHLAPHLHKTLSGFVAESGFAPQRHVVEVHGVCSACGTDADRP